MTAPLFDIKAKFSEYVTFAENGNVIEGEEEITQADAKIEKIFYKNAGFYAAFYYSRIPKCNSVCGT